MRWTVYFIGALLVGYAVCYGIGASIDEHSTEKVSLEINDTRSKVWGVLTDYASYPKWIPSMKSNVREVNGAGQEVWVSEDTRGFKLAITTKEEVPPQKLVRAIADKKLPVTGGWTFELEDLGEKTKLTITADGNIKSPMIRFVSHVFKSGKKRLDEFAENLVKRVDAL